MGISDIVERGKRQACKKEDRSKKRKEGEGREGRRQATKKEGKKGGRKRGRKGGKEG